MEYYNDYVSFYDMGLDDRLLKAISNMKWVEPTLVQQRTIPLALDGKDLLLRSKTGSGKTAAYAIPVIQHIIRMKKEMKSVEDKNQSTSVIVIVPSRDLSQQAFSMIKELSSFCQKDVACIDVSSQETDLLRAKLAQKPDIIVGTPSRILHCVNCGLVDLMGSLQWVVLDEADLLLTYGYENEINELASHMNSTFQGVLVSATLSEDVKKLKRLVLRNPVTLDLSEGDNSLNESLLQFYIKCETDTDKFIAIVALIRLNLLKGTFLIFVNDVSTSYRLKLFLEHFSISCCVLNSELPANSRQHTVQKLNKGLYQFVVATDESSLLLNESSVGVDSPANNRKAKRKRKNAKNYSASHGIDFENLANVINFDFPTSVESYIHRVGRTARCNKSGTALSLIKSEELEMFSIIQNNIASPTDSEPIKLFKIDISEMEGFRYRCEDALGQTNAKAVKSARLNELRSEIVKSNKLKEYFIENPSDLAVLEHKLSIKKRRARKMGHVPDYLVPQTVENIVSNKEFEPEPETDGATTHQQTRTSKGNKRQQKSKRKRADPLRTFKYSKSK